MDTRGSILEGRWGSLQDPGGARDAYPDAISWPPRAAIHQVGYAYAFTSIQRALRPLLSGRRSHPVRPVFAAFRSLNNDISGPEVATMRCHCRRRTRVLSTSERCLRQVSPWTSPPVSFEASEKGGV